MGSVRVNSRFLRCSAWMVCLALGMTGCQRTESPQFAAAPKGLCIYYFREFMGVME